MFHANQRYYKKKEPPHGKLFFFEEATTGFEPVITVLQTDALPLGYVAIFSCMY